MISATELLSNKDAIKIAHALRDSLAVNHVHLLEPTDRALTENLRAFGFEVSAGGERPAGAECTLWMPRNCQHPEVVIKAELEDLVVLFPKTRQSGGRVSLVAELVQAGYVPDYTCCLDAMPRDALLLRRGIEGDLLTTVKAVETHLRSSRVHRRELEQRLEVRLAQLEDAQQRIEALQEAHQKAREAAAASLAKAKASQAKATASAAKWKEKYARMEQSLEMRVGRRLSPILGRAQKATRRLQRSLKKRLPGLREPAPLPALPAPKSHGPLAYHDWFLRTRPSADELAKMRTEAAALEFHPTFSLLLLGRDEAQIARVAQMLRAQVYDRWKLCLPEVASPAGLAPELRELLASETRVQFAPPSLAEPEHALTSQITHLADGYVIFLEPDVVLEPEALFEFARLAMHGEADLIYGDEDRLDGEGRYVDPFFKPGWSPDTFLATNYLGGFTAVSKAMAQQACAAGDLPSPFSLYDFLLRATEHTSQIRHLPKVLSHRLPAAMVVDEQPALVAALERRNIEGEVFRDGEVYRVQRKIAEPQKITIIIPTRDRVELLKRCVESIVAQTRGSHYEIVIVDNDSREQSTFDYYHTIPHRILHYEGLFNYSAINNYAVNQTDGEWLLFLNNDVEILAPDWLEAMAEHVQRPEIGAVGARLIFPDDTIQHAGVIMGIMGLAGHAFARFPRAAGGVREQTRMIRNYSAVTAACLMTRRDVFESCAGFDEKNFTNSFQDTDLCLKIRHAGYLIVYTPYAELYHHESASRGLRFENPREVKYFCEKWADALVADPYYNPNLTKTKTDFSPRDLT